MFSVIIKDDADFRKVILSDTLTGTNAEIIPSCGALLHAFTILQNGKTVNIISSYENQNDFDTNAETKGFRSSKLSPFVCRLKKATYNFKNTSYTIKKFLLSKSAIHGLLYNEEFSVKETWANDSEAGVLLQHLYKGTDEGYPFSYSCDIMYQLKKNNELTLTTIVTNTHSSDIPMQDGWHPYFTFGSSINNLQLQINSESIVVFDDELIPTGEYLPYNTFSTAKKIGETFFDNCFTLKDDYTGPACVLKDTVQQLQLEIMPDKNYPYLQIYTPPDRKSIAIENLSGIPDAFNNGVGCTVMSPQCKVQFTTTYKITKLV